MTEQTLTKVEEEKSKKQKPSNIVDQAMMEGFFNIVAWLPVTIISWIASQFDLE